MIMHENDGALQLAAHGREEGDGNYDPGSVREPLNLAMLGEPSLDDDEELVGGDSDGDRAGTDIEEMLRNNQS